MKATFYKAPAKAAAALAMLAGLAIAGYFSSQILLAGMVGCYTGDYYNSGLFWQEEDLFVREAEQWYETSQSIAANVDGPIDYNERQALNELTEALQNSSLRGIRVSQTGEETPIAGMQVTQYMEELPYFYGYDEGNDTAGYKLYLDTSREYGDNASYYRAQYMQRIDSCWDVALYAGIGLAAALLGWMALLVGAGRSANGELHLFGWHRFPFDVLTVLVAVAVALAAAPLEGLSYFSTANDAAYVLPLMAGLCAATAAGGVLAALLWLHTAVARLKAHQFWRTTLAGMVCIWLWRKARGGAQYLREKTQPAQTDGAAAPGVKVLLLGRKKKAAPQGEGEPDAPPAGGNKAVRAGARELKKLGARLAAAGRLLLDLIHHMNVAWKLVLAVAVVLLAAEVVAMQAAYSPGMMLLLLVLDVLAMAAAGFFAVQLDRLKKGGERLAGGDLDYKTPTDHMYWDLQAHAKNLNAISAGMAVAVDERLKSERMKYELLTNVSHDIKTPLTSIINYVDLLKGQDIPEGPAREYIAVLERQAARLKKLIADLIEVSKATTGNITVHAEPLHPGELLRQCVGEYDERLRAQTLEVVLTVPEQEPSIYADGRLLWRVFDNLLGNAVKYAMPGTRVYIDLQTDGAQVVISLKNISRERLGIDASELMERFVRGDAARATEGSGLGLSIAQSLTELMHGRFSLTVDGDLFKIVLHFDRIDA